MAKQIRIALLLTLLVMVAASSWLTKSRLHAWKRPLAVTVHPVIAEPSTSNWVREWKDVDPLTPFFEQRVVFTLAPPSARVPPMRPPPDAPVYEVIWYSLRLRAWAFRDTPRADCHVYVLFHTPTFGRVLEHSGSVPEARLGVVYTFADTRSNGQTQIAIAHELLHTLGATDKDEDRDIMSGKVGANLADALEELHMGELTRTEVGLAR